MIPKQFRAVYECEECGMELEMWNCYVPYFSASCEECEQPRRFYSRKMIHESWEWDYIEED